MSICSRSSERRSRTVPVSNLSYAPAASAPRGRRVTFAHKICSIRFISLDGSTWLTSTRFIIGHREIFHAQFPWVFMREKMGYRAGERRLVVKAVRGEASRMYVDRSA